MPLMSMSLNVQELESPSRKRTHTDYSGNLDELPACDSAKQTQLDVNEVSSRGQCDKDNHFGRWPHSFS